MEDAQSEDVTPGEVVLANGALGELVVSLVMMRKTVTAMELNEESMVVGEREETWVSLVMTVRGGLAMATVAKGAEDREEKGVEGGKE